MKDGNDRGKITFCVAKNGVDNNCGSIERPFATLSRAQLAVREVLAKNRATDVVVYIRDGVFELEESLVFSAPDSPGEKNHVRYRAYPGEKPVVSGGKVIGDWVKGEDNVWTTYLPEVKEGRWWFRSLFAGDNRLTRARYPHDGCAVLEKVGRDGDERFLTIDNLPSIVGPVEGSQMEIVILHLWSESRGIVKAIRGNEVELEYPLGWQGHDAVSPAEGRKVYFEHSAQFALEEGEFYLDKKTGVVHYKAAERENPNEMNTYAPVIETLLCVEDCKNISFEGISFEHTNWTLPESGYSEIQSGHYGTVFEKEPTYALPLAISLANTVGIVFKDCTIAHLGACAMGLGAKTKNSVVDGCHIYDVSGNGIMIGYRPTANPDTNWFNTDWIDKSDSPSGNIVRNCTFARCAAEQFSCVAIWIAFSGDTLISHNLIEDLPYTGICAGFSWSHEPTSQHNCIIEYNEIRNVMKMMFDGAGIYTLGEQPGTVVRNNYIHHVVYGHGIYTDEASRYMLFENNIVFCIGDTAYQHHYGYENVLRNNIFACARVLYIRRYREDPLESFFMDRNIFFVDGGRFIDGTFQNGKFRFENNLYWCTKASPFQFLNITHGCISDWKLLGHDLNGKFLDPMFLDPQNGDFRLCENSPVIKLGFVPIDMSMVGPQVLDNAQNA